MESECDASDRRPREGSGGTIIDDVSRADWISPCQPTSASRSGDDAARHHRGFTSGVSFTRRPGDTYYRRPPHFAVAPVTDYSMLDTWLPLLCADCSTLRIVCPVLAADFTRCPSLSSLRRWQIALLPPPGARAGSRVTPRHGLLRVQHLELRLAYELLRTRCLAFPVVLGLLLARRFPLPRRSRIAPCPTLDPPCRSTDCSVR